MSNLFLAFDFGTKKIGVAIGQRITSTAYPLSALKARCGTPNWNLITNLLEEWKPCEIIVGLPLNVDGTDQPFTISTRKFANKLQYRFNIMVKLHDERLSTIETRSNLFERGGFRFLNKKSIDSSAAVIILESYFEWISVSN